MENDLIRRSDAINEVRDNPFKMSMCASKEDCERMNFAAKLIENRLASIPAVDAVEVVRCRECKYYDMIDRDDVVKACLYWKSFMSKDGYCSIGERREDGDGDGE